MGSAIPATVRPMVLLAALLAAISTVLNLIIIIGCLRYLRQMSSKSYLSFGIGVSSFWMAASCLTATTSSLVHHPSDSYITSSLCSIAGFVTTSTIALTTQLTFGHTLFRFLILVRNARPSHVQIRIFLIACIVMDFALSSIAVVVDKSIFFLHPSGTYCGPDSASYQPLHLVLTSFTLLSIATPILFNGFAYIEIVRVVSVTLSQTSHGQSHIFQTADPIPDLTAALLRRTLAESPEKVKDASIEQALSQRSPSHRDVAEENNEESSLQICVIDEKDQLAESLPAFPCPALVEDSNNIWGAQVFRKKTFDSGLQSVRNESSDSQDPSFLVYSLANSFLVHPTSPQSVSDSDFSAAHTSTSGTSQLSVPLHAGPRSCLKKTNSRVSFAFESRSRCSTNPATKSFAFLRKPEMASHRITEWEVKTETDTSLSEAVNTPQSVVRHMRDDMPLFNLEPIPSSDDLDWDIEDQEIKLKGGLPRVSFTQAGSSMSLDLISLSSKSEVKLKFGSSGTLVNAIEITKTMTTKSRASSSRSVDQKRTQRVLIQSALFVASFLVCWLPLLLSILYQVASGNVAPMWLDFTAIYCLMLYCMLHPFLVVFFDEEIRGHVFRFLRCA